MSGRFRRTKSQDVDLYVPCPHCGGEIRSDANFCRHCGSSEADGWQDEAYDDTDDFDYEQFVDDNFSESTRSTRLPPLWRVVVLVILASFVISLLIHLF